MRYSISISPDTIVPEFCHKTLVQKFIERLPEVEDNHVYLSFLLEALVEFPGKMHCIHSQRKCILKFSNLALFRFGLKLIVQGIDKSN